MGNRTEETIWRNQEGVYKGTNTKNLLGGITNKGWNRYVGFYSNYRTLETTLDLLYFLNLANL